MPATLFLQNSVPNAVTLVQNNVFRAVAIEVGQEVVAVATFFKTMPINANTAKIAPV